MAHNKKGKEMKKLILPTAILGTTLLLSACGSPPLEPSKVVTPIPTSTDSAYLLKKSPPVNPLTKCLHDGYEILKEARGVEYLMDYPKQSQAWVKKLCEDLT